MIIPPLFEFAELSVAEPRIPGKERIVFRPTESINLAQYALLAGWRLDSGAIVPINDYFLWLTDLVAAPPRWLVVYTGKGIDNIGEHNGHAVYIHYWGRDVTLFNFREQIPLLVKFSGVQIGEHLSTLPTFDEYIKQLNPPVSK